MTIEERFEKLAERHEAITQTIELMVLENRERDTKWEKRFGQIVGALEQLTRVAQVHEHRLDGLEGTT